MWSCLWSFQWCIGSRMDLFCRCRHCAANLPHRAIPSFFLPSPSIPWTRVDLLYRPITITCPIIHLLTIAYSLHTARNLLLMASCYLFIRCFVEQRLDLLDLGAAQSGIFGSARNFFGSLSRLEPKIRHNSNHAPKVNTRPYWAYNRPIMPMYDHLCYHLRRGLIFCCVYVMCRQPNWTTAASAQAPSSNILLLSIVSSELEIEVDLVSSK